MIRNRMRSRILFFFMFALLFLGSSIFIHLEQTQEVQTQEEQTVAIPDQDEHPIDAQPVENLTVLAPTPSQYFDPYIVKFKEYYLNQTGKTIDVEHVSKGGVEIVDYVKGQGKQPYEDVVASIGFKEIDELKRGGYLLPYISSNATFINETYLDALVGKNLEGYYTGVSLSAYGIMENNDVLINEGLSNVTGYADLAFNKSYSGQIVMGSPILSRIAHGNLEVMLAHFGWVQGWNASIHLTSLIDQFTTTTGKANNLTAGGDYAATLTKYSYWYEYDQNGWPVEWIWPIEGTYIYILYTGILTGAKNEDNAKYWVDWMLSKEGQRYWVECRYETVLRSDINLPAGMPSVKELAAVAKIEPNYDEDILSVRYDTVTNIFLKLVGYHNSLKNDFDDQAALNGYLDDWIIEPMDRAKVAIDSAFLYIYDASDEDLTDTGEDLLSIAEGLLSEARTMYDFYADHEQAYTLAIDAEYFAILAMTHIEEPEIEEPVLWPYYLIIGIIIIASISISLGIYLNRKQLKRYSRRLEGEVEERTEDLTQANIHLKSLDSLKSMFLASMSHELRTPLNSILGFTGWLLMGKEGELNEEQKNQLGMVKSSGDHLLDLINDILDISKIEAGKVNLVVEKFEITEVVNDVVNSVLPLAKNKGLKLEHDVPKGIILTSDKRRIKQIVMNLVNNAIKFTDSGNVNIEARLLNNKDLEIIVTDTGIGIKNDDVKNLFQPFHQVDMSITRRHEGTGLGLHLSKKLVELLQGSISVSSQYGKGSEFKFCIPIELKEEV